MKILHLADLHLGKNVNGLSMIDDQRYVLNQSLELCKKENIKNIIVSGDVYDRSIPSEEAVSLLNEFLSNVVLENKIKVFMISGNHDSKERLSCFNALLEKTGLYIDSSVEDNLTMTKHVIKEDDLTINLYSLPYVFPGQIRQMSGDESIKSFEDSLKKILSSNDINKEEINFLNTHYFVAGNTGPIQSDSESKRMVGAIEQVSYSVFDDFDYVALGHLHCPQYVGRETVRYAGSPLRYSVDEIKQHKSFTVINVQSKDNISIEEVEIVPLHEFVYIEGTVDELTKDSATKDGRIVFCNLIDESVVINAAARLKIKYPHYVGLNYVNIKNDIDDGEGDLSKEEGFEDLSYEEQFKQFFKFITQKDINEIQNNAVNAVIDELEKEAN